MTTSELYLRGSLFALRVGSGRYMLMHPGSGTVTPTDKLGAWAAGQLIRGQSVAAVRALLDRQAANMEQRFSLFVEALRQLGALSSKPPQLRSRWRVRMLVSLLLGPLCSFFSILLPLLPTSLLAWLCDALPRLPLTRKNLGQALAYIDRNLRSAGYDDATEAWRSEVALMSSRAVTRTYFFGYLCFILSRSKLTRLLDRLIQVEQFAALERAITAAGGGVIATLHNDMFVAVPIYLSLHGHPVSWVAGMNAAGIPLGSADKLFSAYPEWFGDLVDSSAADVRPQLLERLHAGRVIMVLFEARQQRDTPGEEQPTIHFVGHTVRCFYGTAWLARQSQLPAFFTATYREGAHTVLLPPETLRVDEELSMREQIAAMTQQMYTLGEQCIRSHPDAWTCWSYLDALDMKQAVVHV